LSERRKKQSKHITEGFWNNSLQTIVLAECYCPPGMVHKQIKISQQF